MLLQDAVDGFVRTQHLHSSDRGQIVEECMERLAHYLVVYSDLFDEEAADADDWQLDEWEEQLDSHMNELMDGDIEPPLTVYDLKLEQLETSHIREFFGWYLPRELGGDVTSVSEFAAVMRDWWQFLLSTGRIDKAQYLDFLSVLSEIEPDAVRVVKAAHLLFHYVRLAHGLPEHARDSGFSSFVEGHARIGKVGRDGIWLHFDSQPGRIGPVPVSREIADLLQVGDVLDVELGQRGGVWIMVDIGPIYPASIYVEAEQFDQFESASRLT
jgi:hypothetical protein